MPEVPHSDIVRDRNAEKFRLAERERAKRFQPGLNLIIGDQLTVREARRAFKSSVIFKVTIPARPIFGQEEVQVEISKRAALALLPEGQEWNDWTTEFYLTDAVTIELR